MNQIRVKKNSAIFGWKNGGFFRPLCEREADTILKLEMQEGQFPSSFGIYWKKKEISDITEEDEQIELSRRR